MLFSDKHVTQVSDATLFFYLFTSRILTFAGERSDRTNVKIRLVNGQSPGVGKSLLAVKKKSVIFELLLSCGYQGCNELCENFFL